MSSRTISVTLEIETDLPVPQLRKDLKYALECKGEVRQIQVMVIDRTKINETRGGPDNRPSRILDVKTDRSPRQDSDSIKKKQRGLQ